MSGTAVLGVDLAAEAARTATVRIDWTDQVGVVTDVRVGVADDEISALTGTVAKVGIDCPLGWPVGFVEFVSAHLAGRVDVPADTVAARRTLVYRETDRFCQAQGLRPLSVAADRIGHAALRCATLLARLGGDDRSGTGLVAEVYPAASLRRWGLPYRSYKADPPTIAASLTTLADAVPLRFEQAADRRRCLDSDHGFDALVAALTARAVVLGRTAGPPPEHAELARREGWIRLPDCELPELAGPANGQSGVT